MFDEPVEVKGEGGDGRDEDNDDKDDEADDPLFHDEGERLVVGFTVRMEGQGSKCRIVVCFDLR